MRIIQLGVSLFDEDGRQPSPVSTWQFNFEWDLETERHFPKSIQMLKEHGIDFAKFKGHGIPQQYFAEKATSSGLVLNDRLSWVCFHGNQDFGFLLKLLTNENLPASRGQFEPLLRHYFPRVLDIKTFMESYNLIGGLEKISKQLDVVRGGTQHQAGSDSLVTGQVFFAIFNNMATEQDVKELQSVHEAYNLDIYGYSNDQAYGFGYSSEAASLPLGGTLRGTYASGHPSDIHGGHSTQLPSQAPALPGHQAPERNGQVILEPTPEPEFYHEAQPQPELSDARVPMAGFVPTSTIGPQSYVPSRVQMDQFAYQQLQNMNGGGYHLQQFGSPLDARPTPAQQQMHGQQDLNQFMLLQQLS